MSFLRNSSKRQCLFSIYCIKSEMNEVKNIVGISQLLTSDGDDADIIAQLEKDIIQGSDIGIPEDDIDAAQEYEKEMNQLAKNFENNPSDDTNGGDKETRDPKTPSWNISKSNTDDEKQNDEMDDLLSPRRSINVDNYASGAPRSEFKTSAFDRGDKQIKKMTQEETRQKHINRVLSTVDDKDAEFDIDKERDEDEKTSLLERIDMLRDTLYDDGIDTSTVPQVDRNSSLAEIRDVHKILRLKNDRSRCCGLANELILAGAYGLESLFDGKREWFGHSPDLTGWSDTVKVKLRRMRYETSTLVQDIMQDYQMGPGWRLLIELIPSIFLYSRNRRLTQNDTLMNSDKFKLEQQTQRAISQMNGNI